MSPRAELADAAIYAAHLTPATTLVVFVIVVIGLARALRALRDDTKEEG